MKTPFAPSAFLGAKRSSLLVALAATVLAGCGGHGSGDSVSSAPKIRTQPISMTAAIGTSVTLRVSASGGTLTYQWYKGTQAISGANSASYTIDEVTSASYGSYSVVVSNEASSTSSASVTLSEPDSGAPRITTQPVSQVVTAGNPVTFSVVATGEGTLTYQWYKTGAAIDGATSASFTIASVGASDAASYFVRVTNDNGFTDSSSATLSFASTTAPSITAQPATTVQVNQGQTATFRVTASGQAPLQYQWYKGETAVANATGSTFNLVGATAGDAGTYHVVVTNSLGSVRSNDSVLTVVVAPVITTQPTNQSTTLGGSATFTVVASGTAPLIYKWYRQSSSGTFTEISGATSASYTVTNANTSTPTVYYVTVQNNAGLVKSNNVTLTIKLPPTITTDPLSKTVGLGQTANFTVAATDPNGGALTYQWYKNGGLITGATGTSYTTPATVSGDNQATFYVRVTNEAGTTQSATATLTVVPAPVITSQPQAITVTAGQTATFSVTATGTTLTYQWYKNGAAISGATSASYTTPATTVAADNNATFYVVVTESGVITTQSNSAKLTVNP